MMKIIYRQSASKCVFHAQENHVAFIKLAVVRAGNKAVNVHKTLVVPCALGKIRSVCSLNFNIKAAAGSVLYIDIKPDSL